MKHIISIILPNFNHYPYLKERLNSIFNQTHQDFEVIILDDASTDTSLSILNKYKDHPKVSHFIINKENSGSPFKQWKKGLELAISDYIWIAESDDFCDLDFLEKQLKLLETVDMSVARTLVFSKDKKRKEIMHPAFREDTATLLDVDQIFYCPVLNVSSALFRKIDKNDLAKSKFADFNIIGDRVFYYEFFHKKRLEYNGSTQSYFRQEDENLSNLDCKDRAYLIRYFKEHVRFINFAINGNPKLKSYKKAYIDRFFNRVRHRLGRKEKLSFSFLHLYVYYRFQRLK